MNNFYLSVSGPDNYALVTSNSEYTGEYDSSISFVSNSAFEITKNTFFDKEDEFPFSDCTIKKIEFPATLSKIDSNAFRSLSCLEEIVFSNGYSKEHPLLICEGAFSANGNLERLKKDPMKVKSKLTKVTLPDYITFNIGSYNIDNKLGHPPFWRTPWSENMLEYEFKQNAICIQTGTGSNESIKYLFPNLKAISVKDMESIPENYFKECLSLAKVSNFENIKHIGAAAFKDCRNVREINLCNVEQIDNCAFKGCYSLTSITLNNIKQIGNCAFENCNNLKEVKLGNVEEIGDSAFANCSKIKRIDIPDSIIEIGYGAFKGCSSLKIVQISNELKAQIINSNQFDSIKQMRTICNMPVQKQPSIWRINSRRKN